MSNNDLVALLAGSGEIARQYGDTYNADLFDAASAEIAALRAETSAMRGEIIRLRARISDAEIIGAAVRLPPTGQPKHRRVHITWRDGSDWHWFLLLGFEPAGHLRLQGIDDPEDGTRHDGGVIRVHWDQIASMEER